MALSKVFFINISMLITIAYLFNLGYKSAFQWLHPRVREFAGSVIFMASGWLTMLFGLQVNDHILFDLRFLPLIMAVLIVSRAWHMLLIGVGIGIGRLFFGINEASLAGMINMFILAVAAALLVVILEKKPHWSYFAKAALTIGTINLLNVVNISWLGVMETSVYWGEYAPLTLPLSLALSSFFVFMIRDFTRDQQRMLDLRKMNLVLCRQTKELREAKRELEIRAEQLLLSTRYKSEFLANMSHELKTPLNSMLLISQLIQESEDGDGEEDKRYAGIINAAGVELLHLIDDILDLSMVEAGKLQLNIEPVPSSELLHSVQAQLQPLADRRSLPFRVEMAAGTPELLSTDALRVSQVLRNLLVNAFKFTDSGYVELRVWGERRVLTPARDTEGDWIVFAVRDTGIGIEKEKQDLIFEAFQQEDGSITRQYGGTGLGLSISLQLAKLLGGMLELESEKGKGSTFIFRMPIHSSQNQEQGSL